jgi:hypothetical protein
MYMSISSSDSNYCSHSSIAGNASVDIKVIVMQNLSTISFASTVCVVVI